MIDHYYAEEPMDAENKVLFASREVLQTIESWGKAKLQMRPTDKTYGIQVQTYISTLGTVDLVNHPLLEVGYAGTAYLLDMAGIQVGALQGRAQDARDVVAEPCARVDLTDRAHVIDTSTSIGIAAMARERSITRVTVVGPTRRIATIAGVVPLHAVDCVSAASTVSMSPCASMDASAKELRTVAPTAASSRPNRYPTRRSIESLRYRRVCDRLSPVSPVR